MERLRKVLVHQQHEVFLPSIDPNIATIGSNQHHSRLTLCPGKTSVGLTVSFRSNLWNRKKTGHKDIYHLPERICRLSGPACKRPLPPRLAAWRPPVASAVHAGSGCLGPGALPIWDHTERQRVTTSTLCFTPQEVDWAPGSSILPLVHRGIPSHTGLRTPWWADWLLVLTFSSVGIPWSCLPNKWLWCCIFVSDWF